MARTGKTAQEFIQSSFSPIVAVLCSQKVENIVSKNNVTFPELLQPFCNLDWEGQFREPGGNTCVIKNMKLIVRDVNWKPLQPTEARRQLNNAVLYNYNDKTISVELAGRSFLIPQSTHWFDAWRETYLDVQFPSDHEFTKHFLSCIIVGTTDDENVVDTFNGLNQQYAQLQNVMPPKLPKWFNNCILKTYLLLHDVSVVSKERADAVFDTLKHAFGPNSCFMLPINSKSTSDANVPADLWSQYIKRSPDSTSDVASTFSNLATTPAEQAPIFPSQNIIERGEDTLTGSVQESVHPLTSPETDVYDNANSLQTHSFSGSVESVSVSAKGIDLSTEVHGAALNNNDIEAIKKFLQEYASKALLPYIEKQISQLSESVANRKGVSRSLLSATKRWFGTGKGGNATGNSAVVYTNDCPELQLRRLGDLWFLCGQWQRAFDTYHTAKREFYADSAWLCYAGALEMAAISAFMAGDSNRKTHGYLEESIVTYLNTCRMVQYAVRATLLSVICLTSSGLHGEAAKQLIRMTSEDSDLRSAMLLEQAALCFLSGPGTKAMCRKYAFHMVLAGHRFSKAGQKKHAYRCYKQAHQVYSGSGWRLATDHVQFALGRLAGALRRAHDAVQWLAAPLAPHPPQPPAQQEAFLREYMHAHQQWQESSEERRSRLEKLPLPVAEVSMTRVACAGPAPLSSPRRCGATSLCVQAPRRDPHEERVWRTLEEMLVQVARGAVPMIFKPTLDLYDDTTDCHPLVPQGEPIQISVTLWNPLKISLILKDVELLWRFTPLNESGDSDDNNSIYNEIALAQGVEVASNVIVGQKLPSVVLEGDSKKSLIFSLTPMKVGQVYIQGLAYKLINAGEGASENSTGVSIQGKVDLMSGVKSMDKRLEITVIPEAPCLQMTFSETNPDIISGEIRTVDVELTNVGPVDMKNVFIAVSHPECVSVVTPDNVVDDFKILYDEKFREITPNSEERGRGAEAWRRAAARHVRAARCGPAVLLLRPHCAAARLHLLAYYETGLERRPYRLLRHVFRFNVVDAVDITINPRRSLKTVNESVAEIVNLSVEVSNISENKSDQINIELLEAAFLSRQWKITNLIAARDKNDILAPREKLHLVFKGHRILEAVPEGRVETSCVKISEGHPDSIADITSPPYSKFMIDKKSSFIDSADNTFNQDIEKRSGLLQSMFVLRWKAQDETTGRSAVGQHCLWLDCFNKVQYGEKVLVTDNNPPLPLDENESKLDVTENKKNIKKDNVVMFKMEHSKQINHDFNERRLCIIPVTLSIVNCYGVPVRVFINMSKQKNRETSGRELGWTGALHNGPDADSKEIGVSIHLEKFETRRVQVQGVCAAPGTYLVGSAFTVTTQGTEPHMNVTDVSNNTSLLVLQQA